MKKLNIIKNNIIETQWLTIKTKFKSGNYDLNELDNLTCDLIAQLAVLTTNGHTEVDGITVDTYKNRVWNVIENIGLLPEYKGEEELIETIIEDTWGTIEENELEVDDSEFYK